MQHLAKFFFTFGVKQVHDKSSVGKNVVDEIADYIKGSYPNKESGIVYCFSRKECEQVRLSFYNLISPLILILLICSIFLS